MYVRGTSDGWVVACALYERVMICLFHTVHVASPFHAYRTLDKAVHTHKAMCRTIVSFTRVYRVKISFVSLGLHCFLRLSAAGLIVVLIPGCC